MTATDETSRSEYVYKQLRREILEGRIRPGQRLREVALAHELGVSRTPVRDALRRLSSERLVANAGSRGLVVRQLDRQEINELYAMREELEGCAARFAAQHASENEIAEMRFLLEAGRALQGDPEALSKNNRQFHQIIYQATHNRYLLQALNELSASLSLFPQTTLVAEGRAQLAQQQHAEIVAAIEQRNPSAAEAITRRHLRDAHRLRLRMLSDTSD